MSLSNKRIACWISEKKLQKLNWQEFQKICCDNGFEAFKLNLEDDLESQGPFNVLLHKLTDIIIMANEGNEMCKSKMKKIEAYLAKNPTVIVMDPISKVQQLLDRYKCYSLIHAMNKSNFNVVTPSFCEIRTNDTKVISELLNITNVRYPFLCKPIVGHGAKAHEMAIIFNEENLKDCKPPCVAQTFVAHNAVLYKIFIVGEQIHVCERPSLKNFRACDKDTIYFDSASVSKAGSQSQLTVLDVEDREKAITKPDRNILEMVAFSLKEAFGLDLFGIDVVIENCTGKYTVIDVNAFPGYDGFPDFPMALASCIKTKIGNK